MKRPVFWLGLTVLAAVCTFVAIRYFPRAFSIVALDIRMDREAALAEARAVALRDEMAPAGFRQAASFALDGAAQTFVELEGGGKDAFTRMLREGLYSAYTWRVRHFREGDPNEVTIRFTPEGRPYGFVQRLDEQAPGAALDAAQARAVAEKEAAARWGVDLSGVTLVEQGQDRRVGGRIDHTITYERASPTLNDGRYRLRLGVAGDRLSEVTWFVRVPEAFERRHAGMRAANDAIGVGSVLGMALLYVFGGIGVGLFFMLRRRWVIWRPALYWGGAVALLQGAAAVNELPLLWMSYDTAVPRTTFLAQQAALVLASVVGFTAFFALSFMAAETLGRRAFGHHPQFWRLWSGAPREAAPGASTAVLGRTTAGLLLVPVFLAYQVLLYMTATRYFGWWSPSEALLHPDVLATYVPWLSAIANSLQAGFWEEALFRAVPLAGATLIGERLGRRRLFLAIGFVVQALIFGAGHAQYAAQPAYARVVELFLPSIGFGLLYVFFGLLPAIVLHYAFDVVLFALPIFMSAGIPFQKLAVVLFTLVPLWIVLLRRAQSGGWTELSPADLNAAWKPPAAEAAAIHEPARVRAALGSRARAAWLAVGAAGALVVIAAAAAAERGGLTSTRTDAAVAARRAIESRGVTLDARWRLMPVPDNGAGGPHEFVSTTAGEEQRRELIGKYLPEPVWRVRAASFEGDVADRAEEWLVTVGSGANVHTVTHILPENRAGASLDEDAARQMAVATLRDRYGLDPARGDVSEVSAQPVRHPSRTDWTFTFADRTGTPLPGGERRLRIGIAGDEVAATNRFVYVPEDWLRDARAAGTRNLVIRILATMILAGVLAAAAVHAIIAWSRRTFTPALFATAGGAMLAISLARTLNALPVTTASLPTAAPLPLQMLGVIGIGFVGLAILSAIVGLVAGAAPQRLAPAAYLSGEDAVRLGSAVGLAGAAVSVASAWLETPGWARAPELAAAGAFVPFLQTAGEPLARLMMAAAVLLAVLLLVDRLTAGWTRRRLAGGAILVLAGLAAAGTPPGLAVGGWLAAGLLRGIALAVAYATLLRYDLTMVPHAAGSMIAAGTLMQGAARAYPGALPGALAGALLATLLGWWLSAALRRARVGTPADPQIQISV